MHGRHVRIPRGTYEDLIVQTGTAGKNRIDLICMTYAKNDSNGTEQAYLQVIKGAETEGTAQIPVYTDGNILEGAILNQMPLYKVVIEGIYLKELVPMFTVIPTYKTLAEQYAKQFKATIKALKDADILDTMEEIEANTQENMFAGALAVKEGLGELKSDVRDNYMRRYTSVEQLGIDTEPKHTIVKVANALPDHSIFIGNLQDFYNDDSTIKNQIPSEFGTITIKQGELNDIEIEISVRDSLGGGKYYCVDHLSYMISKPIVFEKIALNSDLGYLADRLDVISSALLVDLYNPKGYNNRPVRVQKGVTTDIPTDCVWGIRDVYWMSASENTQHAYLIVKIIGVTKDEKIKEWFTQYNGIDWREWESNVTNSDINEWVPISKDEIFNNMLVEFTTFVGYKKGKKIYVFFNCKGSITSNQAGTVNIFECKQQYKPKVRTNTGICVNSHTTGQVYTPASAILLVSGLCFISFPNVNTVYGNNSYSWCTGDGIALEWEIE
jgi:hypothetical protein